MKITEADGATTNFSFSSEVPNAPVANLDFVFTAPPNVTIVEGLPPV
jgi:hypothetical protein